MAEPIKVQGSWDGWVQTARVPAVGETIMLAGLPRLVKSVCHVPLPWTPPPIFGGGTLMISGEQATAVVTVADEEP